MADRTEPSVLIVEDDHDIRDALQSVLEQEGFRVCTAENGRDAISMLHRDPPPSVMLIDLMMPVMNGWELVAEMHAEPRLAGIPVVVVSAVGPGQPLPEGVQVLRKPVPIDRLLEVVREHYPRAHR